MDVHPRHLRLTVPLHHAEEFPAVALIKPGEIRDQIQGADASGAHVLHSHIEQPTGDPPAAAVCFRIDRADIRSQILAVMEVVFNDSQPSDDPITDEAQLPVVFRFPIQTGRHAFQICLRRHTPLFVKPGSRPVFQFRVITYSNKLHLLLQIQLSIPFAFSHAVISSGRDDPPE